VLTLQHDSLDIISIAENIFAAIIEITHYSADMHEAESQYTKQVSQKLKAEYPSKNVLVYHNQQSVIKLCRLRRFYYWRSMADLLQRLTPFMLTMSLTSVWGVLRATRSGSSTLALSHWLATVGL
jgi:hypothetical protein